MVLEIMDVAVKGARATVEDLLREDWPDIHVIVSSRDDRRRRVTLSVLLATWSELAELAVAAAVVQASREYSPAIFIEADVVTPDELLEMASDRTHSLLEPTFR